ncbi:GDP-6-deoxy-D-mannose reductase [Pseudomonas fluorescens]|uniref:GDP-6-deoxy-D-mannose reductase n=1 Tax=Pseudomonas fluorescens TaxID=294 RepID=A0A5E7RWI0_PSEFL|nr:SDR family oxidoreductase [Pseudomonas fluorescens]VVP77637.1 GDP-6-deoxy-D-mannose reductase [Pseudomonas fluorescens]
MTTDQAPVLKRVVVTGASGFVGGALINTLAEHRHYLPVPVARSNSNLDMANAFRISELSSSTNWGHILKDASVVIHAAARVHVMKEVASDALAEFRKVNVEGTINLARQAADAGVKRFVFISSIKVNGESTALGHPFTAEDAPAPSDPYGISKHEAEEALRLLSVETGMEVVIIRPTLIYGPGVKANFRNMMAWLYKGIPLPFGSVGNKRSLVSLDNLVSLIMVCLEHPSAAGQTFLVSDGADLSTTELLELTAKALGVKSRLLPVPGQWMAFCANALGRRSISQRLFGSLQVDIKKTQTLLGWHPTVTVEEALNRTAQDFLAHH